MSPSIPHTLEEFLKTFPGSTDTMIKYKSAIVIGVYRLVRPTYIELTGYLKGVLDADDPRFDRNVVYHIAILRAEKIIKRITLSDEDIYVIDDTHKHTITQILDPSPHISSMVADTSDEVASTDLNQSLLLVPCAPVTPLTSLTPPVIDHSVNTDTSSCVLV